jgi:hypothetical protein
MVDILCSFEYIADEFSHENDVKEMIVELLRVILNVSAQ